MKYIEYAAGLILVMHAIMLLKYIPGIYDELGLPYSLLFIAIILSVSLGGYKCLFNAH